MYSLSRARRCYSACALTLDKCISIPPLFRSGSGSLHPPTFARSLQTQAAIFESLGILKDDLDGWYDKLDDICGPGGFPPVEKWSNSESDAEIGMQVRDAGLVA